MNEQTGTPGDLLAAMLQAPQQLFTQLGAGNSAAIPAGWSEAAQQMQAMWLEFQRSSAAATSGQGGEVLAGLGGFAQIMQGWLKVLPLANPDVQKRMWEESLALWQGVLGQYGIGTKAGQGGGAAPDCRARIAASPIPNGASSRSMRWFTRPI